jgi:hypothetical protein
MSSACLSTEVAMVSGFNASRACNVMTGRIIVVLMNDAIKALHSVFHRMQEPDFRLIKSQGRIK